MRNVIVTGGSRGLGLCLVKTLSQLGYGIIAVARTRNEDLDQALRDAPTPSHFVPHDFNKTAEIDDLVKSISKMAGPIYGLVNNAATSLNGMLAMENPGRIEELLRINLLAPILLTRSVLRGMMTNGSGRIINISSINASTGYSGLSAYAASKSGLIGFTRSLAREVGRAGITVNAVAPGFLATDMTGKMDEAKREKILRRSPLKRFATLEEVSSAVSYLLSDAASGMTGSVMTIDAGNSA